MTEEKGPAFTGRAVLRGAALALVLSSTSGCTTIWLWHGATRPVQKSRALGVSGTPAGGERALFAVRDCLDLQDGYYALEIPAGWREMPVRASAWGSDVLELDGRAPPPPAPALRPLRSEMRRLVRLDFSAVALGGPPKEPYAYGVVGVPKGDRFAAQLFGYDPVRLRWVRLGEVPVDSPRVSGVRVAVAAALTPLTVPVDAFLMIGAPFAILEGEVNPAELLPGPDPEVEVRRLIPRLNSADARIRHSAAEELRKYGMRAKPAVPMLRALLADPYAKVRLEAALTLAALCPKDPDFCVPVLADALRSGSVYLRRKIASSLCTRRTKALVPALIDALRDDDALVRRNAAKTLGEMGAHAPETALALQTALGDRSYKVRREAKKALKAIRMEQKPIPARKAGALARRKLAVRAFAKWRSKESIPPLLDALRDDDKEVRKMAAKALARIGPEAREVVPSLVKALEDESAAVRVAAADMLGRIGPDAWEAVPALLRALRKHGGGSYVKALRQIQKKKRP